MTSVPRWSLGVVLCLCAAYAVVALFHAFALVNHDYETEYLALGSLVVRGELNLYQDEMRGHWPPLPFYVYGLEQALLGPSLLAGRLLSVAIGGVVLGLVMLLAWQWAGPVAAAAAAALYCSHGVVIGYFSTVHFAGLVAVLHLLAIYVLFCTDWRWRELIAVVVVSMLFLVKNNFWPTIPVVLAVAVWRSRSPRERLGLVAIALSVPIAFFAWDVRHVKMLAYVPVVRHWLEPLGYQPWYALTEDAAQVAVSDYADIAWEHSASGRVGAIAAATLFLLKRYAVWVGLFSVLGALALARSRAVRSDAVRSAVGFGGRQGLAFTFWLFVYLVACQFVVLGPYAKQAVGFVGAVAPLLAVSIGCLFAIVLEQAADSAPLYRGVVAILMFGVLVSPWLHRHHNLPRRIVPEEASIVVLPRVAHDLAALIPSGERRVFSLADPMALHLAGRRAYLRQFSQERWGFTSLGDPVRYHRVGMWGPSELEAWLGADARYAVLESDVVQFYRNRERYRPILARMDALLAERFTLIGAVEARSHDTFRVYRRRDISAAR